jgi:predicted nucleic acid-binding protein
MIAVDTNVIVRFLTGDDQDQSARARALIEAETVFVPTTVLLETEWVLRAAYGFGNKAVESALRAFAGLPTVTLQDGPATAQALDGMARGLDFADALHLAAAGECEAFATFDARLAKAANRLGAIQARAP